MEKRTLNLLTVFNDFIEKNSADAKIIVEAIKKQIPIKPRYYVDIYGHNRPGCPGCPRNEILYPWQRYCSVCGTKIDWSGEK